MGKEHRSTFADFRKGGMLALARDNHVRYRPCAEFRLQPSTLAHHRWHGDPPVLTQFGQYHGAGVLTGLGLRRRHRAQRKRLPLTAVFGRNFLPVLRMFFAIGLSGILSDQLVAAPMASAWSNRA